MFSIDSAASLKDDSSNKSQRGVKQSIALQYTRTQCQAGGNFCGTSVPTFRVTGANFHQKAEAKQQNAIFRGFHFLHAALYTSANRAFQPCTGCLRYKWRQRGYASAVHELLAANTKGENRSFLQMICNYARKSSAMKEYRYELARKQQQVNLRNRVKW